MGIHVSDELTLWIKELRHPEYEHRQRAAQALLGVGEAAVGPLILLLETGTHPVARVRAAELLGQLGALQALLPLCRVLEHELDPDIRRAVRAALIPLEEKPVTRLVDTLLPELSRLASEEDRTLALEWLVRFYGRTADPDRQRILAAASNTAMPEHSPWQERFQVSFMRLEPPQETPSLSYIPLPHDPEALVQLLAHADYATRTAATAKLANLGEAALEALRQGLRSGSYVVRSRSIEALGKLRHPGSVPVLVEARRVHAGLVSEIDSALLHLVEVLTDEPQADHFGLYSRLVRDFVDEVPALATLALRAIIVLARKHPERLHRTVLPLIKTRPRWGIGTTTPMLVRLARELDTLTEAYKDLPIPAEPSREIHDLPRPSQKD